jgi:hypothetical protein
MRATSLAVLACVACVSSREPSAAARPSTAAVGGNPAVLAPQPWAAIDPAVPVAEVCASTGTIEASLRPANLLFVIDRSGSMGCNLPPVTGSAECEQLVQKAQPELPSKWEVVRSALEAAILLLPEATSAGISYFSNDDQCGVQSKPSVPLRALDAAQLTSLHDSLASVVPRGGTPIVGSLILAYKHLNPDQTPGQPYGNRFVVLLTDGQEGCAPDATQRLLDTEMPKARQASITTFVIGVPGSESNRGFLSRLAFQGGTASVLSCDHESTDPTQGDCHFDMTRDSDLAGGLTRALSAISGRALSCEFDVPRASDRGALDYDQVNIVYSERPGDPEQIIVRDATRPCDGGADGWQYNGDKTRISVCGAACERVRRAASIRIALGCKTIVPD